MDAFKALHRFIPIFLFVVKCVSVTGGQIDYEWTRFDGPNWPDYYPKEAIQVGTDTSGLPIFIVLDDKAEKLDSFLPRSFTNQPQYNKILTTRCQTNRNWFNWIKVVEWRPVDEDILRRAVRVESKQGREFYIGKSIGGWDVEPIIKNAGNYLRMRDGREDFELLQIHDLHRDACRFSVPYSNNLMRRGEQIPSPASVPPPITARSMLTSSSKPTTRPPIAPTTISPILPVSAPVPFLASSFPPTSAPEPRSTLKPTSTLMLTQEASSQPLTAPQPSIPTPQTLKSKVHSVTRTQPTAAMLSSAVGSTPLSPTIITDPTTDPIRTSILSTSQSKLEPLAMVTQTTPSSKSLTPPPTSIPVQTLKPTLPPKSLSHPVLRSVLRSYSVSPKAAVPVPIPASSVPSTPVKKPLTVTETSMLPTQRSTHQSIFLLKPTTKTPLGVATMCSAVVIPVPVTNPAIPLLPRLNTSRSRPKPTPPPIVARRPRPRPLSSPQAPMPPPALRSIMSSEYLPKSTSRRPLKAVFPSTAVVPTASRSFPPPLTLPKSSESLTLPLSVSAPTSSPTSPHEFAPRPPFSPQITITQQQRLEPTPPARLAHRPTLEPQISLFPLKPAPKPPLMASTISPVENVPEPVPVPPPVVPPKPFSRKRPRLKPTPPLIILAKRPLVPPLPSTPTQRTQPTEAPKYLSKSARRPPPAAATLSREVAVLTGNPWPPLKSPGFSPKMQTKPLLQIKPTPPPIAEKQRKKPLTPPSPPMQALTPRFALTKKSMANVPRPPITAAISSPEMRIPTGPLLFPLLGSPPGSALVRRKKLKPTPPSIPVHRPMSKLIPHPIMPELTYSQAREIPESLPCLVPQPQSHDLVLEPSLDRPPQPRPL